MSSSKLFNNVKIDNICVNKDIFAGYVELYKIFNNQVKKNNLKSSREMIKILEDVFIMATKMNKKIIEYKIKGSTEKTDRIINLNKTIKLSENILKRFGNK